MVEVLTIALAFIMLMVWLTGLWIGRLAAFAAFAVLFVFLGMALPALHQETVFALPIEIAAAWIVAAVPMWIRRGDEFNQSLHLASKQTHRGV